MNTRPTPKTDAMEFYDAMCDPDRVVEADFARKLERERDEARDAANKAKAYKRVLKETNAQLKRERDEARDTVESLTTTASDLLTALGNARNERDEARAEMIRWMSIAEGRGRTDETLSNQ